MVVFLLLAEDKTWVSPFVIGAHKDGWTLLILRSLVVPFHFLGGGRTAGNAREFVIPNYNISDLEYVIIRIIQ